MPGDINLPISLEMTLDINDLIRFINECREKHARAMETKESELQNSYRCLLVGLAMHPLADYFVAQKWKATKRDDNEPSRAGYIQTILTEDKFLKIFGGEPCFKDTYNIESDIGTAARALLALIWLLSRAAGDYGQTAIRYHIQKIYEDSCKRNNIFVSDDIRIIDKACEELSTYMLRDVPSALFGDITEHDDAESFYGLKGYKYFKDKTISVQTWYHSLSHKKQENLKTRWKIDVELVNIRRTPFRFLDDTSDGVLLLPSDAFTLWFSQLLRKCYGIGDIAKDEKVYDNMRTQHTYKALLWIMCDVKQEEDTLSQKPSKRIMKCMIV